MLENSTMLLEAETNYTLILSVAYFAGFFLAIILGVLFGKYLSKDSYFNEELDMYNLVIVGLINPLSLLFYMFYFLTVLTVKITNFYINKFSS